MLPFVFDCKLSRTNAASLPTTYQVTWSSGTEVYIVDADLESTTTTDVELSDLLLEVLFVVDLPNIWMRMYLKWHGLSHVSTNYSSHRASSRD